MILSLCIYASFFSIGKVNDSRVSGVVKEVKDNQIIVFDKGIGYALFIKEHDLQIGDKVTIEFKSLELEEERNKGGFNEKKYYNGKRIFSKGQVLKLEKTGHQFSLRAGFLNYLSRSRANQSMKYLLAGQKSEEIQNYTSTLQSLSVLHLFAVSGMHFSLLSSMVSKLKSKILIHIVCLLYAICLEGNIAAWRAYLMMVLREMNYNGWNELDRFGLVGIIFIIYNPYIPFNMSFVYSMGMYLAVILFKGEKFQWLYIYFVSLMIQSYFNYSIWPLGILFSFIMTPFIELLFKIFILNTCLYFVLDSLCLYLWQIIIGASTFLSHYSFQLIIGKTPILLVVLYFYCLIYFVYTKKKRGILAFTIVLLGVWSSPYFRNYGEITMIDVGQGDCFLVSLPHQKANFLIDTGGNIQKDLAQDTIIPYLYYRGIRELDGVFISHEDFDHCGALDSLLENFKVKNVIYQFETINIGGIDIQNLNQYMALDKNDGSQVLSMKIGPFHCLFLGDASSIIEEKIVRDFPNLQVNLLNPSIAI